MLKTEVLNIFVIKQFQWRPHVIRKKITGLEVFSEVRQFYQNFMLIFF